MKVAKAAQFAPAVAVSATSAQQAAQQVAEQVAATATQQAAAVEAQKTADAAEKEAALRAQKAADVAEKEAALREQKAADEIIRINDVRTATDALGRKTNLMINLNTIKTLNTDLKAQIARSAKNIDDSQKLTGKIQATRAQISDLTHATETYEKEFLDRKSSAPIYYSGFQTLQDFALLIFFLGYALLSILLILYLYRVAPVGGAVIAASTLVVVFIGATVLMGSIRQYG